MALSVWFMAARPKTLIASISPVCIGSAFAMRENAFDPFLFLWILLFAVCIQIGTNLANDYFDFKKGADTKDRKGPPRATQLGLVTPEAMKKAFIFVFALAFLFSLAPLFKVGLVFAIIPLLSILFGILYTGGPKPLAYLGLSEIFVLVFFGIIATWGAYYAQTLHSDWRPLVAGLGPGLLSSAILAINNLRDVEEDRKAAKKTLIVRFGKTFGKAEYLFCLCGAVCIPFLLFSKGLSLLFLALLFFSYPACRNVIFEKEIASVLPKTALLLFLYSILFCTSVLL